MKIKKLLLLICVLTGITLTSLSQVDSIKYNGEWRYVYPFRQEVDIHNDYWIAVDDEVFYADYRNYFLEFDEIPEVFEAKDFYEADEVDLLYLDKRLKREWGYYRNKGTRISLGSRFVEQVRKNPYAFLYVNYLFEKEVIPPFEAIPDGKYVQLFEDFCLVDADGNCQEQTARVAGVFEIKDNALDGETVWMNLHGSTLKSGTFVNGLKEGHWVQHKPSRIPDYLFAHSARFFKKNGVFEGVHNDVYDAEYSGGILDGAYHSLMNSLGLKETYGRYKKGFPAGNWKIYSDDTLVMNVTFADHSDTIISKKPIIRNGMLVQDQTWEYDLYSCPYELISVPSGFYEINFAKEEELELEEELFNSYELENMNMGYEHMIPPRLYENPDYWLGYSYYSIEKDPKTDHVETRGRFIDSIGAIIKFDGAYELYYPNGQLYTRYLFDKGDLVKEDTLFWSNGLAHDVITFNADSNQYIRTVYDTRGEQFNKLVYDSLGDFSHFYREKTEIITKNFDSIVGKQAPYVFTHDFPFDTITKGDYYYENWSAINDQLEWKTILYKSWSGLNEAPLIQYEFDPELRSLKINEHNYYGSDYYTAERTFTQDYGGWTGTSNWTMNDIEVSNISSGVLQPYHELDTFPQRFVNSSSFYYNVANDRTILRDKKPYNGNVKLKMNRKSFKLSNGGLKMSFSNHWRGNRKTYRKLYKYFDKGVRDKDPLLDIASSIDQAHTLSANAYYQMFGDQLEDFFRYDYAYEESFGFEGRYDRLNNIAKIEGAMIDGKLHGVWKGYNQKGKLLREIEFIDGEPEGTFKTFYIEPRAPKWEREFSEYELPKKKTHFLYSTEEYKGGMLNGDFFQYNWKGEVVMKGNFVDDYLDGPFVEQYPIAYNITNYEEGFKDGYMRTYLTLPFQDTLLLYELNFQNDMLNGRSVAYHTNGSVAKQGFFMDGEPIDDYEAFDTLGTKFHHVKFQYGFPVEEKIWEENELSVRYLFDWRDSVDFDPSDITYTMSLQSVLYSAGYGVEYLEQEYYGRPRLINKTGLTYQMTKYYPNDTVARDGFIRDGQKIGHWDFYSYEGEHLYHVNYFDSIIEINNSVRFKSKGLYSELSANGDTLFQALILEKSEKYDCAHTDHYEIRQYMTLWQTNDSLGRLNGFVRNYYDNGTLQSEGAMKDGLPSGLWKYYDPFGKLNLMGQYALGKRHGRWLSGDLGKKKYLGEICLNPDLPDLEEEMEYRENLLDVMIINYHMGKALNKQFYDLNLNKYSEYQNEE
jgi:antitoxin component YwqK of YwqJK toxin-antitoxin module